MALTFLINGVNRRANLRDGTLSIDKHLGLEVLTAQVVETVSPGAGAFRPTLGHAVYVKDGTDLLFGGEIIERREETVWQTGGLPALTLNTITAKSYDAIAERIVLDAFAVAAQGLYTTVNTLFTTYLSPLGITMLSPSSGGPGLSALEFDHQTLAGLFNQLTLLSGYPWRINGDKQFAFDAPGALIGPAITEATALESDLRVEQTRAIRVNRLFLQTGGSGTVTHHEGRTLNGVQTVFLLNVEPTDPPTVVTENGSDHTIGGGTWTYNAALKAIVRASPGTIGHAISTAYPVTFPAWVRVWDASVQAASGAWTTTALVDGLTEASEQTDLAQAKAWGDEELSRRFLEPHIVTVRTRTKGYYPLLHVSLTLPDSNITGAYLVESVRVEAQDDDHIVYQAVCVQDDVLHTAWFDYFKRRGATTGGGMSVGGATGSTGGTPGTPPPSTAGGVFTPLFAGGDNDRGLRSATYRDIPNAVPLLIGGPGWPASLRLQSYVMVDTPGQSVRLQIWNTAGGVLAGPTPAATPTSMSELALTFATPTVPTRVLVQYVAPGASGEAFVGMTQLEAAA